MVRGLVSERTEKHAEPHPAAAGADERLGVLSRRQVLMGAAGFATLAGLGGALLAPAPPAAAAVPQRYGRGYGGGYR